MANTRTTLAAALGVDDTFLTLASATNVAAGSILKIDDEIVVVQKDYLSGVVANIRRGQIGTRTQAHVTTAGVTIYGTAAADFMDPATASIVNFPLAGRTRSLTSLTASATLAQSEPGSDQVVVLNGTGAITLTVAVPDAAKDGDLLFIVSNGAAQHLLTFTGGLSGAGGSYDVITINATAPAAFGFIACNKLWMAICGPAVSGTTTNIAGAIA